MVWSSIVKDEHHQSPPADEALVESSPSRDRCSVRRHPRTCVAGATSAPSVGLTADGLCAPPAGLTCAATGENRLTLLADRGSLRLSAAAGPPAHRTLRSARH